jgi:Subtilase family
LTFAASALGQSFEKTGPAYYPMDSSGNSKAATAEVSVDAERVELGWRAHFGFDGKVGESADSDGDGVSDAEEARQWTDPLGNDEDTKKLTPDQRRQAAMELYRAAPISIDGKPATPAEVLAKEEREGMELSRSLRFSADQAKTRVEKWSKRTGQPIHQGGKGQPGTVVIDVEGDRPIVWADYGTVSNDFAVIPPLWPGGAVGSNVTGYAGLLNGVPVRKNSGMWEVDAPRISHVELAGRISIADNAVFDPAKYHATFVAGIMAASGVDTSFIGGAYGSKVTAYNVVNNFDEIAALPNATIKDMRASNHSYGKLNGWGPPLSVGGYEWKMWGGDLVNASAATHWEDYRFGLYTAEAATADTTARNKSYHLLVKAAGNDRLETGTGREWLVLKNGLGQGYHWCFTYYNGLLVLMQQYFGNKYIYATDIGFDYTTGVAYIDDTTPVHTVTGAFQFSADGNSSTYFLGYDSLSEGFGVAKNTLSVGSMYTSFGVPYLSGFSAAGPTDDGRLKPDVMALGGGDNGQDLSGLGAAWSGDYSGSASGTSFAAPAVTGAVTLLSQYQENLRTGKEPLRSSTFKALLCHTADDVNLPGPDYQTGWGVVNAQKAAELIKTNTERRKITEVFLEYEQSALVKVRAIGGQPAKVTIAWNDPAGAVQPNVVDPPGNSGALKVLKNDLNLKVVQTAPLPSATYYPYQPDPANPQNVTDTGVNNRDNVEQVFLANPTANHDYEITIQRQPGTTITSGGQWVSVIMSGFTTVMPAELSVVSVGFQPYYGGNTLCNVVFSSVLGGYYKVQYVPFGAPANSWQDIPGGGIINSRADLCYVSFYLSPSNPVPVRVIALSPNPFSVP